MADSTALRFGFPGATEGVAGLVATPAGTVATVSGDDAVRQSLQLLLATSPGERVMRPHYGCPLDRLVFEPMDDTTAGLAIHHVQRSVRRFVPEVDVLAIDAGPDPDDPVTLVVELTYRVRRSGTEARLAVRLGAGVPDRVTAGDASGRGPAGPRPRRRGGVA